MYEWNCYSNFEVLVQNYILDNSTYIQTGLEWPNLSHRESSHWGWHRVAIRSGLPSKETPEQACMASKTSEGSAWSSKSWLPPGVTHAKAVQDPKGSDMGQPAWLFPGNWRPQGRNSQPSDPPRATARKGPQWGLSRDSQHWLVAQRLQDYPSPPSGGGGGGPGGRGGSDFQMNSPRWLHFCNLQGQNSLAGSQGSNLIPSECGEDTMS